MKSFIRIALILLLPLSLPAQSLDETQDPFSVRWRTLSTAHFDLIFPDSIERQAMWLANLLEVVYPAEQKTMPAPFSHLPLLLSTNSVIANGYVTMAPLRSEFYGTPFLTGSDDGSWYALLTSHEMRHVAQYRRLSQSGLNRFFWGMILGEWGPLIVSSALIPRWFWEGDAVLMETALSKGGRGRKADFDMEIRALELSGRRYSYYTSLFGSYKNYVPNPYPYGYLQVSYARKHFYPRVWADILRRTTFLSFFPFAFSASIRGITGINAPTLYENTLNEYDSLWTARAENLPQTPLQALSPEKLDAYTNYSYPQETGSGGYLVLKNGMADAPSLTRLTKAGKEERMVKQIVPMDRISVRDSLVCWAEYRPHWRWGKQSYSDLFVYNLNSGETKQLTRNGKFFTPAFSADGRRIVAVEFTAGRKNRLVILDAQTGAILHRYEHQEGGRIKTPSWSENGKAIVFTHQSAAGKALTRLNVKTGTMYDVLPANWQGMMTPVFWKGYVLFSSGYSGIYNIYAVRQTDGRIFQVTSRPYGAFNPAISSGKDSLLFNDYSVDGLRAAKMELNPEQWRPVEAVKDRTIPYYETFVQEEQGEEILSDDHVPHIEYPVEDYHPFRHLFNFHSWVISPDSLNTGVWFASNNVLNTAAASAGIFYNRQEKGVGYMAGLSYGGWYPIVELSAQRLYRSAEYKTATGGKITDTWSETVLAAGVRLPLNFSTANCRQQIHLSVAFQAVQVQNRSLPQNFEVNNGDFFPLRYTLSYARVRPYAVKDVRRQWAQMAEALYEHTPLSGDFKGAHFWVRGRLYFPGLFKHHSLRLTAGYEWHKPMNYRFPSYQPLPRGYSFSFHKQALAFNADYALPLLYPDWNLSAWFYLKRVRANIFYDYGVVLDSAGNTVRSSAGVELLFDHYWFSLPMELEMGYRFSYPFGLEKAQHQFIFSLPLD